MEDYGYVVSPLGHNVSEKFTSEMLQMQCINYKEMYTSWGEENGRKSVLKKTVYSCGGY